LTVPSPVIHLPFKLPPVARDIIKSQVVEGDLSKLGTLAGIVVLIKKEIAPILTYLKHF
jgi:hypothetical protein